MTTWVLIGFVFVYGDYHTVNVPHIATQQACESLAANISAAYETNISTFLMWRCVSYDAAAAKEGGGMNAGSNR